LVPRELEFMAGYTDPFLNGLPCYQGE